MSIPSLILAALALGSLEATPEATPELHTSWEAPATYVKGAPYKVSVTVSGSETVRKWLLSPAAFEVDGSPLGKRGDDLLQIPAGGTMTLEFDLGHYLDVDGDFALTFAEGGGEALQVSVLTPAPAQDYMAADAMDLANHQVLFITNKGDILIELWPDVAPNHVKNFLDLASTGFYDQTLFHRVSPSFMIQGGCPNTRDRPNEPNTWGTGGGPRKVQAEFNKKPHVRGVLSAARTSDPNSHSSQFFLMTGASPHLDGSYSAFGSVISGMETVMTIARADGKRGRDGTAKPSEPQRIEKAVVLIGKGE